ncbi:MAG TPA: SPFH domain-containing protein [Dehalococcoidia bacterium]|nr:SPFH domain-containing protein [Dehalococcoidia bacterium]
MAALFVGVGVVLILLVLFLIVATVSQRYVKVPPNLVAVISGRRRSFQSIDGIRQVVGFRVVRGGATIVWPVIERLDYLSLEEMNLLIEVRKAITREGVPLNVDAVANVRIGSDDASIMAAAERFLTFNVEEIHSIVLKTLEGQLRAVLAGLTVEKANDSREEFQQSVTAAASADLAKMGVQIDNIVIQAIWDEVGYLEALGKKRTAEVKRDAEIGAAGARRQEVEQVASNDLAAAQARAVADQKISEAEKARDVARAEYQAEIMGAQAKSAQAGPLADAMAMRAVRVAEVEVERAETDARIGVEEKRIEQSRKAQEADIVVPAMAKRDATVAEAEGRRQALMAEGEGESSKRVALAQARQSELEAEASGRKSNLLAEADGERAKLLAQAEGERQRLLAEAEGKEKLAEALNAMNEAAQLLQILPIIMQAMPDVADRVTRHLAEIDKVTILDMGGGGNGNGNGQGGINRFLSSATGAMKQTFEVVRETTGIDLEHASRRVVENLGMANGGPKDVVVSDPAPEEKE